MASFRSLDMASLTFLATFCSSFFVGIFLALVTSRDLDRLLVLDLDRDRELEREYDLDLDRERVLDLADG